MMKTSKYEIALVWSEWDRIGTGTIATTIFANIKIKWSFECAPVRHKPSGFFFAAAAVDSRNSVEDATN